MRTILVFFKTASPETIGFFLDQLCHPRPTPAANWCFPTLHQPVLYINPYHQQHWTIEIAESWAELLALFPFEPTYALTVNISGRYPGRVELDQLLTYLSGQFECFFMDDYTNHPWTMAEIQNNVLVQNHPFFDVQGWHKETKTHL